MSLIKLKSKNEHLYTSKRNDNFDEDLNEPNVDGDIECKDLIVGKTGSIKGKIKADTLTVEGSVEGEINIKDLLKMMSSSQVSGKICYGSVQINEGGKLLGEIEFKDKNILQEEFKDWKTL